MNDIARALGRALVSQFHPRMLWLAIWPFLVALVFWGVLGFAFRHAAIAWLVAAGSGWMLGSWIDSVFSWVGFDGGLAFVMSIFYFGLIFAAMVLTALVIIATVAMPTVVAHVGGRDYPTLAQKHGGSYLGSLGNALWVGIAFTVGFIVTLPLWLIAPLALLVPLLWWGWATARMFRYDALVAHASAEERATLIDRHGKAFFGIGTIVSLLNFVPPLFFLVPILGGLAFTHYGLAALERLRAERGEIGVAPLGPRDVVA
jgi:hypothetical protein